MTPIRHISTSTVRATNQKEQLTRRIELTPWDLRLMQHDYPQKGLLFHLKPAADQKEAKHNLIQHLKASLSQTLTIFYPLAGRLAVIENADSTTSFFLDCNGAGAHFVHAAADGVTVADILDPVYVPGHIVHKLFPLNGVRNYEGVSNPLLAAQVTELADGFFIGCSINHMVVDGTSLWHFFNTWSEISRTPGSDNIKNISQPRPVFGCDHESYNSVIDLPIRLPMSYDEIRSEHLNSIPRCSDSLPIQVFHFPKEKVAELKSKANAEMGGDYNRISSLQALMAHFWRAITRSRQLHRDREVGYHVVLGMRRRLEPPLPDHYFGNVVLGVTAKCTAGELVLEHGLGWAASQLKKTIASQTAEEARKYLEEWVKSPAFFPTTWDSKNVELITGGSPQFNVFGNDFGWGRPVALRSGGANHMIGELTASPGAEEGSIDFAACLLTETLQAMVDDAEFMEFVQTKISLQV